MHTVYYILLLCTRQSKINYLHQQSSSSGQTLMQLEIPSGEDQPIEEETAFGFHLS